ncbi:coiled-coil domain-containing protein [Apilactobacillus timberlakei]|uniref:hypothetical protein n=1 Tax=Apilactobacillus timberlakei TaxID=2008380 RepID=UPI001129B667|nr:hypothetical protein [Apilactobacillus timberlakei]TPR19076.1 hypothetical protein DYZ95_00220 [Apilactobacillus timberlakei]
MKIVSKLALTALAALSLGGFATSAHADSNFFIHSWDESKTPIPQTSQNNAMQDYNDNDLQIMRNKLPKFKPVWGHYKHVRKTDKPYVYSNTDYSNSANDFTTKWFLPQGFNISQSEHGNYQGIVMANNSIYLLESMGTGANQGAIIRFKLDALENMGLMKDGNENILLNVFNYFNPYTDQGRQNNQDFVNYLNSTSDYRDDMKTSGQKINKLQTAVQNKKTNLNNAQAKYQKLLNAYTKKYGDFDQKVDLNNDNQGRRRSEANRNNRSAKKMLKQIKNVKPLTKQQQAAKKVAKKNLVKATKKYEDLAKKTNAQIKNDQTESNKLNAQIVQDQQNIQQAQDGNPLLGQYESITDSVQSTPLINIGHGQTMSYNPANNHLYLAQDDKISSYSNDDKNQITELDADTLQPVHQYSFKLMHNGSNLGLHTLAFDKQGRAYFGVHTGPNGTKKAYTLYIGSLNNGNISFKPAKQVIHWAGSWNQNVSYNAANNRLYLLSNDVITSVPVDKLNAGTLTGKDVKYTTFNSHREFEGLSFDNKGYGYLLTLWRSEIMKSTYPLQ